MSENIEGNNFMGRMAKALGNIVHAPENAGEWLHHKLGMDTLMGETPERRSKSVDSIVEEVQKTGSVGGITKMGIESSLPEEERIEANRRIDAAKWNYQARQDMSKKGDKNG